jgi:hypothetical protein
MDAQIATPLPENKIVLDAAPEPCAVCLGEYNKNTRKAIQCLYCTSSICRACVQTYLLADGANEPNCPGCRAAWGQEFLVANLTVAFRTRDLKQHREKVLVDRERARLPDTQIDAERYKYAKEAIKPIQENLKYLETQLEKNGARAKLQTVHSQFYENERALHRHYSDWYRRPEIVKATEERNKIIIENATIARLKRNNPESKPIPELKSVPSLPALPDEVKLCNNRRSVLGEDIRILRKEIIPIEKEINACKSLLAPYKYTISHYGIVRGEGVQRTKTERQFVHKCPAPDCAGFLNSSWECGLCHTKACKDCREAVVDADAHVCNPDTVETVKAIAKEARPCPKCGTLISKISGCDQMWCTQCKTAFSWNTGRIETTVIHNPHYFQWMRESGKEIPRRDAPGDGCNVEYRLDSIYRSRTVTRNSTLYRLSQIEMTRRHHANTLLRTLQANLREYEHDEWRRILRVQRLLNELTEEEWKIKLQRKEKAYHKERAQMQLYDMYCNVCRDIMAQLLEDSSDENQRRVMNQWKELRNFMDDERLKINKAYTCKSPDIFENNPVFRDWEKW